MNRKRGYPRYVAFEELLSDPVIIDCLPTEKLEYKSEVLKSALDDAVEHNILLNVPFDKNGNIENVYFLNTESDRRTVDKIKRGDYTELKYRSGKQLEDCGW